MKKSSRSLLYGAILGWLAGALKTPSASHLEKYRKQRDCTTGKGLNFLEVIAAHFD